MAISTTETETPLPSHQRCRQSSKGSSACGSASNPAAMPSSTTEADAPGHHSRSKRPCTSSSAGSLASHPSWVILGRAGARRDDFDGDRTTSAICRTSKGKEISVSFELVEPPGTSVLTLNWPEGPVPLESTLFYTHVIAAHRDVVLFKMTSRVKRPSDLVDYFVYKANRDSSRRPSLSRLPVHYDEELSFAGRPRQHFMSKDETGVLSCSSKKGSSSFIVAQLERTGAVLAEHDLYLFRSGSDKWEVFKKLYVHGANGGSDLFWWSTDVVVPYRRQFLIWVDYYRGMIVAKMSSSSGMKLAPPKLQYIPLPVDTVEEHPDGSNGRGCPQASRSVCATRSGIKFVSVDHQETSSFGIGRMRRWTSTFRITTWSLHEDDYTWIKDATMDPDELWAILDSENQFPHVPPEFPVVNMENPDVVSFLLDESRHTCCGGEMTWMIEVDMTKKVLLACTAYPDDTSSPGNQDTIKTAIRVSQGQTFISTEIPLYLCGGKACKKRRQ